NVGEYGEPGESVYDTIAKSGVCPFLFKSFDGFLEYHTPWSEGREVTHVLRGFVDAAAVCSLLDESGYHGLKLVDNGVIHSKGGLGDVPEVHAYHITPEAADKASGVSKDQELRGISPDESVALGDSVSDLVLAQHVKVMFVVRNGFEDDSHMRDQIRRYDNVFVTENPAGLGFAEAIELLRI
ncbi:MAG: HAD hydrolase family protein, partial [Terriglobia bacterium]